MRKFTVNDLLTSSGRYPDRAKHKDCTDEVKDNAQTLTDKINDLLDDLGISGREYSSGFRTSESNSKTLNAAKLSLHMKGMAGDIIDDMQQTLAYLIMSRPDLLKKHGLWLEHPDSTRGNNTNWVHLDMSDTRKDRASRVFYP